MTAFIQVEMPIGNEPRYGAIKREAIPYNQFLQFIHRDDFGYAMIVTSESMPGWKIPEGSYGVQYRERIP